MCRVVALAGDSVDEVLGANTIAEMMHLDAGDARRVRVRRADGARCDDLSARRLAWIDAQVEVGADTVI